MSALVKRLDRQFDNAVMHAEIQFQDIEFHKKRYADLHEELVTTNQLYKLESDRAFRLSKQIEKLTAKVEALEKAAALPF